MLSDEADSLVKNWYPTHVFENIVPRLKQSGVMEDLIEELFHLQA